MDNAESQRGATNLIEEKSANDYWCPFSRATLYITGHGHHQQAEPVHIIGHGSNRLTTDDPVINEKINAALSGSGCTRCLGAKCAAWRWSSVNGFGRCGLVVGADELDPSAQWRKQQ